MSAPARRRGRDLPPVDSALVLGVTCAAAPCRPSALILLDPPFTIDFARHGTAAAVRVRAPAELGAAMQWLGLAAPRPVIVLAGDAAGGTLAAAVLRPLFDEVLIPRAAARGACIVDGGTDAGVMRLAGRARAQAGGGPPIVGVVVDALAGHPGSPPDDPAGAPLEHHHTHFVLVDGSRWGDEAPWIAAVAGELARSAPSVTVLVGGGDIARDDVGHSVRAGRPVIAVAGSGRTADAIAAAARGAACGAARDASTRELARSGLLRAVDLGDRAGLAAAIDGALGAGGPPT
jgi:hypothetical protein